MVSLIFIKNIRNILVDYTRSCDRLSIKTNEQGLSLVGEQAVVQSSLMQHMQQEPLSANMQLLDSGCEKLGCPLQPTQLQQFQRYYELLVEWNEKFNLTSITDPEGVQTKHFLDSLCGWQVLAEEMKQSANLPVQLIDIGTGAGFPGIPLKILRPHLQVTLVDGTGKKVDFLRHVVQTLNLPTVSLVQGRAEELGRDTLYRNNYDVVTARAVAPLNTLVEYLLPLVRINGFALIYKGASAAEEFIGARKAIELLGGETVRFAPVSVPFLEEKRFVLLIKKVRSTPNLYPRGQGLARKKPL